MNGAMLNAIRLQAQRAMADLASTRVGLITSYEPANFSVRVALQPEGVITGWLPLCSPWIGNGWGMFAAPSVGDMVAVHFFGGDLEAGFVEGRLFNDVDRPLAAPSAEFWLVHKSGSSLKFTNDGTVTLHTQADLVATVGGKLNATVASDATVSVTGNATVGVNGNLGATVGGNVTANVTGSLTATAASFTLNGPTAINGTLTVTGNTEVTGTTTLNGATTINGPLSQAAGTGGGNSTMVGPLNVTGAIAAGTTVTAPTVVGTTDVTFGGKSAVSHKHTGVTTGAGNTGTPL
jgi:hypothetical protein